MKTIKVVNKSGLELPAYSTNGAAAMDVRATGTIVVSSNNITTVSTGLFFKLPDAHKMLILPRSGLAKKYGLTVVNSPGLLDEDYTGELMILLTLVGVPAKTSVTFNGGERIAQVLLEPVTKWQWEQVDTLEETERGSGGFGSTGTV